MDRLNKKLIKVRKKYGIQVNDLAKYIGCSATTLIKYDRGLKISNNKYKDKIKEIIDNPKELYYFYKEDILYQNMSDLDLNRFKQVIISLIHDKEYKIKLYNIINIANNVGLYYTSKTLIGIKNYKDILDETINELEKENTLKEEIIYNDDNSVTEFIIKLKDINLDILDEKQLYVIEKVSNYFKNYKIKDIVNYEINDNNIKIILD